MATQNGSDTLRELVSGTENLLRSTASYGGAEIEAARDRLKHQLDAARIQVRDRGRHAWRRAREVSAATDGYVHENAWKTIAGAVLVGALAAVCLMAESRRR